MRERRAAIWGFKITMTLLPSLIAKKALLPLIAQRAHAFLSKKIVPSLKKRTLHAIINDEVV